jgi:hypothetical protein
MRVASGRDHLRKRGNGPRRAGHHQEPGRDGRGRAQPSKPPDPAQIRAEPLRDGSGPVPQPDDSGLEEAPHDAERHEEVGQVRPTPAGMHAALPRRDLGTDPVKPVGAWLHRVDGHPERVPEGALETGFAGFRAAVAHVPRSSTDRSAAIAREVWLFTAPLVMPIAVAIWASERSA